MLNYIAKAKQSLLAAASIAMILFWAAAQAFFMLRIGQRDFKEFMLPFTACCLLLGATVALSPFHSKIIRFFRYMLAGFCILFAFLSVIAYLYYREQRYRFSYTDVLAFLQSDFYESYYYSSAHIFTPRNITFTFLFMALTLLIIKLGASAVAHIAMNLKRHIALAAVSSAAVCVAFILLADHNVVKTAYSTSDDYFKDIRVFREYNSTFKDQLADAAYKKEKGELYVIVIGESACRDYMHCYGGPAENTPWADALREQPDKVVFENAYSYFSNTEPSVIAALTDSRALTDMLLWTDNKDSKSIRQGIAAISKHQNLVSISRRAGIHTAWLSNQTSWGIWDNRVSSLTNTADDTQFTISNLHSLRAELLPSDSALLPLIEQALNRMDLSNNNLLIVHLAGSHAPYYHRYPNDYSLVNADEPKHLGRLARDRNKENLKNTYQHYLTSIKYTDEVLKSIHETVMRRIDGPAFLLYFSDHGEDFFSESPHNWEVFTWQMVRIPMFLWFSQAYQERYPDKVRSARANRKRIFTGDLVYDLYLGLAGIKTKSYAEEYDISSEKYCLTPENAILFRGKQVKTDPGVIAAQNIGLEHGPALAAHRVNTLFKLKQAQASGLRRFEVDIWHEESGGRSILSVGHDPESMADLNFSEYLGQLARGFDFLWMDMKNLTEENSDTVLALLNALDA